MNRIAILEDDDKLRPHLALELEEAGYHVRGFASAEALEDSLEAGYRPDLLLLDVRLGGKSGVDLARERLPQQALPPTIVISGEASISETVETLELGVHDFLEKPVSRERLLRSVRNCLSFHTLKQRLDRLERQGDGLLLGESSPMLALKRQLDKIGSVDGRVLILGESGVGKELAAEWLHRAGRRAAGPFIKINAAALPAGLIEDELFGHARGAFTGAHEDKPGLFEQAHGGTLFLDEIGDMSHELQARLLRVLEDGRVRRVGGRRDIAVDVRVIAATHRDLEALCREGQFRQDLYFRLNAFPLHVPPLRERGDDISLLAAHFIQHFCRKHRLPPKKVDQAALLAMKRYAWPGNVRELRNLCERLAVLAGNPIREADLPSDLLRGHSGARHAETGLIRLPATGHIPLKDLKRQWEKELIETVLRRRNWDYVATAQDLGIQRTYLHRKITQLGIARPQNRP